MIQLFYGYQGTPEETGINTGSFSPRVGCISSDYSQVGVWEKCAQPVGKAAYTGFISSRDKVAP